MGGSGMKAGMAAVIGCVLLVAQAASGNARAQGAAERAQGAESRSPTADAASAGDPELGRRLYETGIGADGRPVRAVTQGDIPVSGDQFPCTGCHRRSGMGSSEGGRYVPPIAVPYLFQPRESNMILRLERFVEYFKQLQPALFYDDLRKPRLRPAYTDETLARAITQGRDPAGRALDPTMPRYALGETDLRNLIAFLHELGAKPDPGVDGETFHFATIAGPDAAPERVKAYESLVDAYAGWFNRDFSNDTAHPGYSPYYRSDLLYTRRKWTIHHWRLEGPPETWRRQLEAFYAKQPVFAVLGGVVDDPFDAVDAFCNDKRLACIFPVAALPPLKDSYRGGYVLYLSLGLVGEARGLARYLVAEGGEQGMRPLPVLLADDAWGRRAAEALAREWKAAGAPAALHRQVVRKSRRWRQALVRLRGERTAVILPGRQAPAVIKAIAKAGPQQLPERLYLPSSVLPALRTSDLPAETAARLRIVTRYDDPKAIHPDSYRARAWIRSRKLPIPDWDLMRETFFALRLVDNALEPLQADYYRDYLIEILEHITEVGLDPGPFPRPELGPEQRVASRGVYIMRWDPIDQVLVPVSPWVVVGG